MSKTYIQCMLNKYFYECKSLGSCFVKSNITNTLELNKKMPFII